jgi:hypothetical protein
VRRPERILYQLEESCRPEVPSILLHVYCDESYDASHTVYTLAGFLGHEDEWAGLVDQWSARCSLDGISCYHATECAGQWGEFSGLPQEKCIALNSDLITYLAKSKLAGFGISISYRDFEEISQENDRARDFLGPSPYYLGMQILVIRCCHEIKMESTDYTLAFFFDQNEEVSGRAKALYDEVRKRNPGLDTYMRSLTYADKRKLVPLQIADELAFETMKNAQGILEGRRDRKPIARLKGAKVLCSLEMLGRSGLEQIARDGKLNII